MSSVSYLQACGPRPTRAQVGFSRKVAKQQHNKRVKISASEIIYSKEDDNAIDEYHRRAGSYFPVQFKFAARTNTFVLVEAT